MKIKIKSDATCGKVFIPTGEYWVAFNPDARSIALVAGGKNLVIPAVRRRATVKVRITTVQFYCGGGTQWSLVVDTPKHGQWLALIEYARKSED
jgi:hypothetical protein